MRDNYVIEYSVSSSDWVILLVTSNYHYGLEYLKRSRLELAPNWANQNGLLTYWAWWEHQSQPRKKEFYVAVKNLADGVNALKTHEQLQASDGLMAQTQDSEWQRFPISYQWFTRVQHPSTSNNIDNKPPFCYRNPTIGIRLVISSGRSISYKSI